MSEHSFETPDADPLDGFDGVTRLFPLPNVVLFPGVLLPLHIFEPRYRQMVADAMDSDRLVTMVLLKPGTESDTEGSPAIHSVGCLGQIIRHEPLPDGRSNLILLGLTRVRIDLEEANDRRYRTAGVTLLEDSCAPDGADELAGTHQRIVNFIQDIGKVLGQDDAAGLAAADEVPLGKLCDSVCYCLGLDPQVKQTMLEELDVQRRAETLLAWMKAMLQSAERLRDRAHPADFSAN